MTLTDARFILEITPFLATILVETLSSGARVKFAHQLDKVSIDDVVEGAEREDIENAATHSFHFEQCMRYYDLATVATFIVFLTKSLNPDFNSGYTAIAGVVSICTIIALRVKTRKYFENRPPNKYGNIDKLSYNWGLNIELHKGGLWIIIANTVPIVCLISLEMLT